MKGGNVGGENTGNVGQLTIHTKPKPWTYTQADLRRDLASFTESRAE